MLRTRNMESEVYVCKFIFSFVTQTLDNVSGFMPSLFCVHFLCFFTFSCCIFCKRGGRGGDHALRSGTQIIDPSARARVTQLRARSRRAAGTAPELMIALRGLGSRRREVRRARASEAWLFRMGRRRCPRSPAAPEAIEMRTAPIEKCGLLESTPPAMTGGQ